MTYKGLGTVMEEWSTKGNPLGKPNCGTGSISRQNDNRLSSGDMVYTILLAVYLKKAGASREVFLLSLQKGKYGDSKRAFNRMLFLKLP